MRGFAIDAGGSLFAPGLQALLRGFAPSTGDERNSRMRRMRTYLYKLERRLDDLLAIIPATTAGEKLQRVIKRYRQNLFVFVTNRELPATNNGSERALRPCAVYRKVTNRFRSEWGAKFYADIRLRPQNRPA
jgi:transposase